MNRPPVDLIVERAMRAATSSDAGAGAVEELIRIAQGRRASLEAAHSVLVERLHRESQPLVFYVHPWEYDPDHPRVEMPRRFPHFTHYHNLRSMTPKTRRLLRDFRFTTFREAYGAAWSA